MRVVLLCHAATSASRTVAFAGDEPLDAGGISSASAMAGSLPRVDAVVRAPSTRCQQTAAALGLAELAVPVESLAGCDFGAWTGHTLDEVLGNAPEAVTSWLTEPAASPHGGESITALLARVGHWLDGLTGVRAVLAVVDPAVIRAAIVHAIEARPRSVWRIDVAPLSQAVLVGDPGRWSLRALRPPAPARPS